MRLRKILCIFLTAMLMVASFSFAVLADEEGKTYTMPDGLTFTVPPEIDMVMWVGMDEDDPIFEEEEMTYTNVQDTYKYMGIEFQSPLGSISGNEDQVFIIQQSVKELFEILLN